jgi:hypothetical protein
MYVEYFGVREREYYDLAHDPFEVSNAIDDPSYAMKISRAKAAAKRLCVPLPPGG